MSTASLCALIERANEEALALVPVCQAAGHDWVSEGGRGCPKDFTDACGQAVYRCRTCGVYDYGEPGGPGARDCEHHCPGPDPRFVDTEETS